MTESRHSIYDAVKRVTFGMPFTIVFSVIVGVAAVPLAGVLVDGIYSQYDRIFPVVEASGALISQGNDEAVVAIGGSIRRNCIRLRLQAYALGTDGNMYDAFIVRTDMPEKPDTRPLGSFQVGTWRVWPLPNSRGLSIYVSHLCGSRIVLTKIVDLPLTPKEPAP